MDTAVGLAQGLLAAAALAAGLVNLAGRAPRTITKPLACWTAAYYSGRQAKVIGACQVLVAYALILPPALGVLPFLVGVGAVGVLALVFEASLEQILRGKRGPSRSTSLSGRSRCS